MDSVNREEGGERRAGRSKRREEAMVAGETGRDGEMVGIDGEMVEVGGEMVGVETGPVGSDSTDINAMVVTVE